MMNVFLFARPKFPAGIPSTAEQNVALDVQLDAGRGRPGHFEHDAFEYSGKRSHDLLQTATAATPVVTTVLSADVKEDDSFQAYDAAGSLLSSAGAAASQLVSTVIPVAGMAAVGFANLRNTGNGAPATPAAADKPGA